MTWYFQHQRATEIIAEHQREADRIRLARLAADGVVPPPPRPAFATVRRSLARPIGAVGRTATRIAGALDVDAEPTGGWSGDSATLRLDRKSIPPR